MGAIHRFRRNVARLRAEVCNTPTIDELLDRVLEASQRSLDLGECARSTHDQRRSVQRYIRESLGPVRCSLVVVEDCEQLKFALREHRATANHVLKLLRRVLDLAVESGHRGDNPARSVTNFPDRNREDRLDREHLVRVLGALDTLELQPRANTSVLDAIRLLIYTGARRREITRLEWSQVYLDLRIIVPGIVKGALRRYGLCTEAAALLARRPRGSRWVFPGRSPAKPVEQLHYAWTKALAVAELDHVPLHALRHSWVTLASLHGSTEQVRVAIGHSSAHMTRRYAHLAVRDTLPLVERVGSELGKAAGDA